MRRASTALFGASIVGVWFFTSAGCTWLISFDDAPVGAPDAEQTVEDASDQDSDRSPPPRPVTACDPSFPLDQVHGCTNFVEGGQICADHQAFLPYPGNPRTDLVTCSKSGATCVRHCNVCLHFPSGVPDQCDECSGLDDGTYCDSDVGWSSSRVRLIVRCSGGLALDFRACNGPCDSQGGRGNASCR